MKKYEKLYAVTANMEVIELNVTNQEMIDGDIIIKTKLPEDSPFKDQEGKISILFYELKLLPLGEFDMKVFESATEAYNHAQAMVIYDLENAKQKVLRLEKLKSRLQLEQAIFEEAEDCKDNNISVKTMLQIAKDSQYF